ncbi:MAG: hypothetical protein AAF242_17840, partial [Bacteroidota bacterium]
MLRKCTPLWLVLCLFLSNLLNAQEQSILSATEYDVDAKAHFDDTRRDRMMYTETNAYRFDADWASQLRTGSDSTIWIPIQIHIAKTGNYYAANLFNTALFISQANEALADANIQLYNCSPMNIIDKDSVYHLFYTYQDQVLAPYEVPNVLNIYFVGEYKQSSYGPFYCGSSSYPGQGERIIYSTYCFGFNSQTVINHLLGQYFSLFPTHGPSGATPELVTRGTGANCSFAGDELCDTPADPNLNTSGYMSGCSYVGTVTDGNGAQYTPDTTNYMSYAPGTCRDHFTPMQLARMEYSARFDRTYLGCNNGGAKCDNPIDAYPYTESFEAGLNDWDAAAYYSTFTSAVFALNSGATPTVGTGPASASNGQNYVYAEADFPIPQSGAVYPVATLESPCFDFTNITNPEMIFDYHMFGQDATQFSVQMSRDGGIYFEPGGVVFNISGDQGNAWITDTLDLTSYGGESCVVLRFVAGFNSGSLGDIAVDHIRVGNSGSAYTCNPPVAEVTASDYTCGSTTNGGDAVLNITQQTVAPYTIEWSTGDTATTQLSGLGTGFFSVTLTDANG